MVLSATMICLKLRIVSSHSLLIDNHRHASLAVHSLSTVDPYRVGIIDRNGIGRELVASGREEPRVYTIGTAMQSYRLARRVKSGLRCAVIARHKLELYKVPDGCLDATWGICQGTRAADLDDLDATGYWLSVSRQNR